jgi:hypothetical protein
MCTPPPIEGLLRRLVEDVRAVLELIALHRRDSVAPGQQLEDPAILHADGMVAEGRGLDEVQVL